MTTQSKDQRIEVGAPVKVEAGRVSTSGVVLGVSRRLDDRAGITATIGEAPQASSDLLAGFKKREDDRKTIAPAEAVELTGSASTLRDWESPTIPGWINGEKISGIPGANVDLGSIDPDDIANGAIGESLIADESIGIEELSSALKLFIAQSGGGDGKAGFQNLPAELQALFLKLEKYPEADRVVAADPSPDALSENLVENPTLEGSGGLAEGWAKTGSGWAFEAVAGDPGARFSGAAGTAGSITTAIAGLVEGHRYRLAYRVTGQFAGAVRAVLGGTSGFIRRFADSWSEEIVAGPGGDLVIEGLSDDDGADISIDDVFLWQLTRTAGIAPRISDPIAHRYELDSSQSFSYDVDEAVWEFQHPDRWTFDDDAGTATYFGPVGGRSIVRFIIPASEIRQPVSANVFPREIILAFEFRILEMLNPSRHGSFATGQNQEFTNFPGGVSLKAPGDLRAVGLGSSNATHYRTQWYDKIGKFCGLLPFVEPVRFTPGALAIELGPNLIGDPEFGNVTTGGVSSGWYSVGTGWTLADLSSGAQLGYALFFAPVGDNVNGYMTTDLPLEVGATYRLTYDVRHQTKGRVKPELGLAAGLVRQAAGTYSEDIVFTGGGNFLRFQGIIDRSGFGAPNGADISIDNVRLQRLIIPNAAGDRYAIELWIAAQGATIMNPRFNLIARRADPDFRGRATEETPTAAWLPSVAVDV